MGKLKYNIEIGARYGRLVIVEEIDPIKSKRQNNRAVRCRCDCGNIVDMMFDRLRCKHSCGCLHIDTARELGLSKATHKLTKTSIYRRWQDMKRRCRKKPTKRKIKGYEHYGGKGIRVCKEWENSFVKFYNWAIKNGYSNELVLDRKKNSKGYSPSNCRWVTYADSNRNTSRNIIVGGLCLQDYCEKNNLPYKRINARMRVYGYSLKDALSLPINSRRKK